MNEKQLDYLFDLQGYLILRNAISQEELAAMNQWVDDHYSPRFIRTRFNYEWSAGLLKRLTPERRQISEPLPRRRAG